MTQQHRHNNQHKPRALDLFCGGGGVALGLQAAGFQVVGVDIEKHNNYPAPMVRAEESLNSTSQA